ncbi:helix-turn-helix domain-containing protein [Limibaculum sp. M0105]|uniref:Helix-turn-helix domain-containing protein n=1 Tax=Thermohalobaculum xanthum TaxID=2753746 RepID=A0A8J7SDK3_9RHOB|nr:XRE family transcriptional regulator [Thermohalobaculum xanthum]MBK0399283.1 helix-turn-helix domain-containing protein [Thermohalobaculum xanthum]
MKAARLEETARAGGVGADLRALRRARNLTLAALALRIGRSVGWLSEVERGITDPPIADLRRIANALDQPLSLFFGGAEGPEAERGHVVRAGARRTLGGAGEGLCEELLSPDLSGSFEIVRSVFAPGARLTEPVTRPTEEAGYIVSGTLEIEIEGARHRLGPGDSFRIRGEAFRWRNPGTEPAVAIWVIAPPVY